jgi:sensor c-di-GMP phosphodiesterase-like protein
MTLMNNANIKQFQLIKFMNENCTDDHMMSKISIVLRRDKIEAPYYMTTNIKLSSCVDMPENGLIHAMDMLNHTRRHNLTEDAYNEIKSLIVESNSESGQVISENDKQLKMVLMSKNDEEFRNLLNDYGELFDRIDNLID